MGRDERASSPGKDRASRVRDIGDSVRYSTCRIVHTKIIRGFHIDIGGSVRYRA